MGKKSKNAKNQNQFKTNLPKGAPGIVCGVALITLGIMMAISAIWNGSFYALQSIHAFMYGFAGKLSFFLPFCLIFSGTLLITRVFHKVSGKTWIFCVALFFCTAAFATMTTFMNGGGSLMEQITRSNENMQFARPKSFSAYLHTAYQWGKSDQIGGGLMGMLLAFPLWTLLNQVGAIILLALCMLILLCAALQLHPIQWIFAKPAQEEQSEASVDPQTQGGYSSSGEAVTRPVAQNYQPVAAPITQPSYVPDSKNNAASSAPAQQIEGGFFPVTGQQLYEEPLFMQDPDSLYLPPDPSPVQSERSSYSQPAEIVTENKYSALSVQEEKSTRKTEDFYSEDQDAAEAPVELSVSEPEIPASSKPVQRKTPRRNTETSMPAESQMTDQVLYGNAKPVSTAGAVELTGERVPLSSVSSSITKKTQERNSPETGLDGKPAPVYKSPVFTVPDAPYTPPVMSLLEEGIDRSGEDHTQEDSLRAQKIEETLKSFKIPARVMQVMHGPAITRFAIQIAPGIKVRQVTGVADNLGLNLATKHLRMEAPIQGTNFIGIEVPNQSITPVKLREVLDSNAMRANKSPLAVALGKDIAGTPIICNLQSMPHLLIAGSTGSGKSVCIQSIVCSLLYRADPAEVRLIMIDPKQVELNMYNGIPHLLLPVITDMRKAAGALTWVVQEMRERYTKMEEMKERELNGYNKHLPEGEKLPFIVVIIDEFADLMDTNRKEVEDCIRQLAALARAAGIFLVLATQRPSVDVITGVIKNNIPSRIAFAVSSGTDSRTILDIIGAEKLMGKGDMLYKPTGSSPTRVQGCFVSTEESYAIANYIREHNAENYNEEIMDLLQNEQSSSPSAPDIVSSGENTDPQSDDLLTQAIQMAIEDGQISTSMLQRRLRIGYARAGRLVDEMEQMNIVSAQDGSKPRKTIMTREEFMEEFGETLH